MTGKQVLIIGGGAAGLMASITAARRGAAVVLLEHNAKPGKKLLATGNGRCNLTNLSCDLSKYRGTDSSFVSDALELYGVSQTIRFFSELGIYTKNRNGWIYPASEQAASVLEVLEMEARHLQVKIKTKEQVSSILIEKEGFLVKTETWTYPAASVILATGSKASSIEGADESGYQLARSLGHDIIPPLPALVSLRCRGDFFSKWSGVRIEGNVSLMIGELTYRTEYGELQLTEYGISGIPIFQLSRYAVRLLAEGQKVELQVDFLPDISRSALPAFLEMRHKNCPYKTKKESLIGLFPKKLIEVLMQDKPTDQELVKRIKGFSLELQGAHSYQQAQVCSGGVDTRQVQSKTMESSLHKGLFFAGEILDIDGACGGYNLQWAWSSGAVAGMNA